ncbi:MAG: hypothetical protein M1831_007252 [Alyxoria varia]|nr:MAG: hypothetical protein M1831_007252 [Alyxoria varia]
MARTKKAPTSGLKDREGTMRDKSFPFRSSSTPGPNPNSQDSSMNGHMEVDGFTTGGHQPPNDEGYHTGLQNSFKSTHSTHQSNGATSFDSSPSEGLSGIDILGQKVKELISVTNRLEQVGIEGSKISIPKIVVIGDQSAGKSSIIEAISEIQVPRSGGTCTRCPIQINLTNDPNHEWRCQLKIHKKFDYFSSQSFRGRPKSPWHEKHQPADIWTATVDKTNLTTLLHRAQIAVLNPNQSPGDIMNGLEVHQNLSQFSPNVVQLDISGPSLPTLTLYDLPGIINESETENSDSAHLPTMVRELAKEYIASPCSIVVLTRPMGVDPATSSAGALVNEMNARSRCLGVLTKPDHFPEGESLDQWSSLLNNKKFSVGHGYYVTKQPSQKELNEGISHEQARANERAYFEQTEPWSTYFVNHRAKCGTEKLREKLSQLLAAVISASLPSIKEQVDGKLHSLQQQLAQFPEPTENCLGVVVKLVENFKSELEKMILGYMPHNAFVKEWEAQVEGFKKQLDGLKPVVVVSTGPESGWNMNHASSSDPICLDSDDESGATPSPGSKRPLEGTPMNTPTPKRPRNDADRNKKVKYYRLPDIRQTVKEISRSGRPSTTDPRAEDYLIQESTKEWREPLIDFMENMSQHLNRSVEGILEGLLNVWESTALPGEFHRVVQKELKIMVDWHKENSDRILHAEQLKPFTRNEALLAFCTKEQQTNLAHMRHKARCKFYLQEKEGANGRFTQGPEREKKLQAITEKDLGEDPYKAEMEVMAHIRGYYSLASAEFLDNICKSMRFEVFERARLQLGDNLANELNIYADNGFQVCKRLLTEDPEREEMRESLHREKAKLMSAKTVLENMPTYH